MTCGYLKDGLGTLDEGKGETREYSHCSGAQVRKASMSRRQTRLAVFNNTKKRTYGVLKFIIRMELCNAVGILEKGRGQEKDSLLQEMSFLLSISSRV